MKHCTRCNTTKNLNESSPAARTGKGGFCKACAAKYQRSWRERNRKRSRKNSSEYYKKHPKKIMIYQAKRRAKISGIAFSIIEQDFEIPEYCPVLGIKLSRRSEGDKDYSPSLDRLIPYLGYVPGNVVVMSWRANRLKSDGSLHDFEKLVDFLKKTIDSQSES